ncbi:MAG: hypothetical protein AB1331_00225 [Bacillota bacterium]
MNPYPGGMGDPAALALIFLILYDHPAISRRVGHGQRWLAQREVQ